MDRIDNTMQVIEEKRFRTVIENSAAGYFFIDREGYFRDVNTTWLRLHKYESADEILGQHISITQTESDKERASVIIDQLLGGETVTGGEIMRRCRDGSIGWHILSANPRTSQDGEIVGFEGFIIDITDRKLAENELRISEEKFRTITEQTTDLIALTDSYGFVQYVSPASKTYLPI